MISDSSDSDVEGAAAALAVLLLRRRRRRQRRFGVHAVLQKRKQVGQFHAILASLKADEQRFKTYTRMSLATFQNLLGMLAARLTKKSFTAITAEERLVVCLRYLSQGDSFVTIGTNFCMGDNTVGKIVRETCQAIVDALAPRYFSLPSTPDEWRDIAKGFWDRWNLPNACGAIDGKHIRIKAPAHSGTLFHNYKGHFSTVLLAVADARYRILYASVGSFGHENDAGIFDRSDFGQMVKDPGNPLNLPPSANLPGTEQLCPYFFIGDAAFPLRANLQKPYSQRGMSREKTIFNYRISRARRVVESTFGILTQRWRVLLRAIETTPEACDVTVKALACLHNFLLDEGQTQQPPEGPDGPDMPPNAPLLQPANMRNNMANRAPVEGIEVQARLTNFFVTAGALDWQAEHLGI